MPKFLTNIDLTKNELQNAVIHVLASAPSSPVDGQIYYNSTDDHLWYRSNGAWVDVTNALTLAGVPAASYALLASPTFTGTPLAPTASQGTNTTQIATTAYVITEIAARLAAADALRYMGAIDASSNPNYPAGNAGDTYRISVAGKIGGASGPNVEVGDMLILHVDGSAGGNHATVGTDWDIIQTNIDGGTTADNTQTFTNKTINLSNNTLSGTLAQFNTALSDGDFASLAGSETLTNKTINLSSNTLSGTIAQFNTALSDGDFATLAGSETLTNKTLTTPTIASFVNATHNHQNAAGGGTLAEAALALTDITTNDATTARHGFLKKLSNDAGQYMDGTGNWSTPPGSGVGKYATSIGDGVATSYVVTHSLGNRDVVISIHDNSTPWAEVFADVEHTSTTTATIRFAVAPTSNQFRVTVLG